MAKQLKKIFDPGVDEVVQNFTIESWHVSQSVDAFRGDDDYDITISGSLTISGSTFISGSPTSTGTGYSTLVIDDSTGQLYVTGSYGGSGVAGTSGTSGTSGANGTSGTSGTGGAASPGGSNTHIQFNQLGSFGGESAFTYNSGSQIVTIDKSTTATSNSPHIKLLGDSSGQGALSGVIAASATTQNSSPASIKFRNASPHGLGDYSTDVILSTALYDGVSSTSERIALTLSASGEAYFSYDVFAPALDNVTQANVVGWNSSTGELTYFSTSSISGGSTLTRPSTATNVVYNVDVDGSWTNLATATGPNPTSAGQFTTNSSTPASVNQIKINKTGNAANDQSSQLEDLAVSSSITITQAGGGAGFGNYRIVTKTDNTSYMTYDVVNWGSSGGTFTNTEISTIESDGRGVYEYILNSGYNLLNIQNNGDPVDRLRLKIPNDSSPGSQVIVEAAVSSSSQNVIFSYQARSGSVSSTGQVNKDLYYIGSDATSSLVLSDTNDVAVMEFVCWGTGSSVNYGLAPSVAMQVFNN